jgi:general L-amino acid transport system substrate-binding protein
MRRSTRLMFVPMMLVAAVAGAQPSPMLDRVQARGTVRCGSVERPGLAGRDGSGRWSGLEVDVCRAVAAAVLGSPDKIVFSTYATPRQFEAVRENQDDLFFLTGSEIHEQNLEGGLLLGPTVFVESHAVMVPAASAVRHLTDLAGVTVCYMIGSSTERSLSNALERLPKPWLRRAFSEVGEMRDTYNAQSCHAIAGELTDLASYRLDQGVNQLESRILPERTTLFPIVAATGRTDARWSAVVSWVVATLISSERPETRWYAGGAGAMPLPAADPALPPKWQSRVLTAVGSYGDIFDRNLGKGSRLQLERGPNANQADGGLLLSPFLD